MRNRMEDFIYQKWQDEQNDLHIGLIFDPSASNVRNPGRLVCPQSMFVYCQFSLSSYNFLGG